MLSPGDRIGTAIEAAGERLARRVAIETGDRRLAHVAGQPGTLQQPLGVDHQVIVDFLQALLEAPPFAVAQGLPEVLAPAPDRHRDHPRHRRMPGGNLGETFLHHPVELDAGNRPGGVGKRRQGVDHVAEGRGLDQQYPHPATSAGRRPAAPGLAIPGQAAARGGNCSGRSDRCARSTGCTRDRGGRSPPGPPAAGELRRGGAIDAHQRAIQRGRHVHQAGIVGHHRASAGHQVDGLGQRSLPGKIEGLLAQPRIRRWRISSPPGWSFFEPNSQTCQPARIFASATAA